MQQSLAQRRNGIWLSLAVLLTLVCFAIVIPSLAQAENPLYCNGEYTLNNGCTEGPRAHIHVNEGKNENGGCIALEFWEVNYGYTSPANEFCDETGVIETTHKEESFPRCWNRTNAKDLLHCRYNTW
ncbi:MAG TPA: hypothetical protein VIH92_01095 [Solirubrobacteraceae bacterium]|jgi:hypothetical protein